MTDRVLRYFQTPLAPDFLKHMVEETGLTREQQEMVLELREHTGDTAFFADRANMPVKRYNAVIASVCVRLVTELLRLAQIGFRKSK